MNDPANWLYQELAPVMDRLELLSTVAKRARLVNRAFGSHMSPMEIAASFADEDIELLLLLPTE